MRKLALALLATAALSVPAMAASNANQQTQYPQDQQSQAQQSQAQNTHNQAQPNNTYNQAQPNNNSQAQNQENNQQTIAPKQLSRNQVRQIQQALDKNGFQVGRVDGRWGTKTSDAVKQFQQSKNIQASGQLDQQTLSDLGLNGAQFAQQNEGNGSQQH